MRHCLLLCLILISSVASAAEHRVFIGTYTRGDSISEGIYTTTFDTESGKLAPATLAAKTDNPSFLTVHPSNKFLFACIETNDYEGNPTGAVAAFKINANNGQLELINQRSSEGGAPCHCNVDATGRFLLVANYLGGNVAVFPIADDGALAEPSCVINHIGSGPNKQRQEAPHAHSINLSADNKFAYAADLGIDRVMIFRFDSQDGQLVPSAADSVVLAAGGGPRHFSIHPSGKFAYTNKELTCEATALQRNPATGSLKVMQNISTLPADFNGRKSTAECLVHPNGKSLYVSNRGHDSIAAYNIDQESGQLTLIEIEKTQGKEPRNFFIMPDGKWLIAENQNSDTVVVFSISPDGSLSPANSKIAVGKPVCLRIVQ